MYYKREDDILQQATEVFGPDFSLLPDNHSEHVYPVDGWYWFESLDAAMGALTQTEIKDGVPQVVSRFQARAALYQAGLFDQIETLMQNSETPMLARLAWQDAQEFKRQSPTVLAMASALGLNDEQLDSLFITAYGIEV
jgi:hypothetical protein